MQDLNKLETPTEEQLEKIEDIEAKLLEIDKSLYYGPMVVDMSEEAKTYSVPEGEENRVHIRMFTGNRYDPNTAKEIAMYTIQKFSINDFKNFEKQAPRLGYKYGFMHKPAGFKSIYNEK